VSLPPVLADAVTLIESPLSGFNFFIDLDEPTGLPAFQIAMLAVMASGGFTDAKGLSAELEVLAYPEGGVNDYVHQLPVRHSWGRITLRRGLMQDTALWQWYQAGLVGSLGARRNGGITMLDDSGIPAMRWAFKNGLATKWIGPELNAQTGAVAIEALEIAHEGLELQSLASAIGDVVGLTGVSG
jgi:phage tail-like protein